MSTELMKMDEVAAFLRVSRSTAYRLVRRKQLRAVRLGGCVRVKREDVDALIQGATAKGGKKARSS